MRRWDGIVGTAAGEGLDVDAAAARLGQLAVDDYRREGFDEDVIAAAEDRTDYVMEASGLYRAHTHHR